MDNVKLKIFKGLIIISLFLGVSTIDFVYSNIDTKIMRDGELKCTSDWIINAERTSFLLGKDIVKTNKTTGENYTVWKESYYQSKIKCPKIEALGGYRTEKTCRYPPDYYERLKRSNINTKVDYIENSFQYLLLRNVPYYKYGTRGDYAGSILEYSYYDKKTDREDEFPTKYNIRWTPKDTRNYQFTWRLKKLNTSAYPDGNYSACSYVFGNVTIDLKDNCKDLKKVEIEDGTALIHFQNMRGTQYYDLGFVDSEIEKPKDSVPIKSDGYLQVRSVSDNYDDVLLITNDQSAISLQIGDYFDNKRNVRYRMNISTPEVETIDCATFSSDIRIPIEEYITDNGIKDTINYIITTKGVPLRISDGKSSVDSELTIINSSRINYICVSGSRANNPYYSKNQKFSSSYYDMYIVTRLTGYDYNNITAMIDKGDFGWQNLKFVFDISPDHDGGAYQIANDWMRTANTLLKNKGYNSIKNETNLYLTQKTGVLGYTSWGSNDNYDLDNGKPNNSWVPGALAETFVSTSARSFNYPPSYGQSLIADLIAEGVTGASGNVYEPYLSASIRPNILFDRYTEGYNLGESYYMANKYLSWMKVIVGDPKVSIENRSE